MYTRLMGVRKMLILNFLSIFILLGVGADDVLILTDAFRVTSLDAETRHAPAAVRLQARRLAGARACVCAARAGGCMCVYACPAGGGAMVSVRGRCKNVIARLQATFEKAGWSMFVTSLTSAARYNYNQISIIITITITITYVRHGEYCRRGK